MGTLLASLNIDWAIVVSTIVGGLIGIFGSTLPFWLNKRTTQNLAQRAFLNQLNHTYVTLVSLSKVENNLLYTDLIFDKEWHTHLCHIPKLNSREHQTLVEWYGLINLLESEAKQNNNLLNREKMNTILKIYGDQIYKIYIKINITKISAFALLFNVYDEIYYEIKLRIHKHFYKDLFPRV